jgi:endo-1,4-beta-xylanase
MLALLIVISLFRGAFQAGGFEPLHRIADRARVRLGSCVDISLLRSNGDDGKYASALAEAVNLVEPENDLKPVYIWLGPGRYRFDNPDFLIGAPGRKGWAQQHGMTVRGHVLVWARDDVPVLPDWLKAAEPQITPDQARAMLRDYIHAVVGRYRGKIFAWDVVNEAIADWPNGNPLNLRNSFWFRKLGPDFLADAFKFAHEADPKVKLYYNEYSWENGGWKAGAVFKLVEFLRSRNAPIDGLGLQYHVELHDSTRPGDDHEKVFKRIEAEKLDFMVTELDVAVECADVPRADPAWGAMATDPGLLQRQAEVYGSIVKMALSFRRCKGVQLWGFTDRHSWIPYEHERMGAALDFDAEYRPKPAAYAIEDALQDRVGRRP